MTRTRRRDVVRYAYYKSIDAVFIPLLRFSMGLTTRIQDKHRSERHQVLTMKRDVSRPEAKPLGSGPTISIVREDSIGKPDSKMCTEIWKKMLIRYR